MLESNETAHVGVAVSITYLICPGGTSYGGRLFIGCHWCRVIMYSIFLSMPGNHAEVVATSNSLRVNAEVIFV